MRYALILLFTFIVWSCNERTNKKGFSIVATDTIQADTSLIYTDSKLNQQEKKVLTDAKNDSQDTASILHLYIDLMSEFYESEGVYLPLYYKENTTFPDITFNETIYHCEEITRTRIPNEIAEAYLDVSLLDSVILFDESQKITDTLYRENYEYLEDLIQSSKIVSYSHQQKLPENAVAISYVAGIDQYIGVIEDFDKDTVLRKKLSIQANIRKRDVTDFGSMVIAGDEISYLSYHDYQKTLSKVYLMKNNQLMDSIIQEYVVYDLLPVPIAIEDHFLYVASCGVPDTDFIWRQLIAIDVNKVKFRLLGRNRVSLKNNQLQ